MNFRLIRPAHLIDLNGVAELSYLKMDNGTLRLGATARQRELERAAIVAQHWPLLCEAASYIGHVQIRNRGTVGGSLAHAFPSAELPVAMVTLDASFALRSKTRERRARAEDFFLSYSIRRESDPRKKDSSSCPFVSSSLRGLRHCRTVGYLIRAAPCRSCTWWGRSNTSSSPAGTSR